MDQVIPLAERVGVRDLPAHEAPPSKPRGATEAIQQLLRNVNPALLPVHEPTLEGPRDEEQPVKGPHRGLDPVRHVLKMPFDQVVPAPLVPVEEDHLPPLPKPGPHVPRETRELRAVRTQRLERQVHRRQLRPPAAKRDQVPAHQRRPQLGRRQGRPVQQHRTGEVRDRHGRPRLGLPGARGKHVPRPGPALDEHPLQHVPEELEPHLPDLEDLPPYAVPLVPAIPEPLEAVKERVPQVGAPHLEDHAPSVRVLGEGAQGRLEGEEGVPRLPHGLEARVHVHRAAKRREVLVVP